MSIEGVDYAFSVPPASALTAAGKYFAVRYGGPGSAGKQLTQAELAGLNKAGIAVVANAEGAAAGFRGTAAGQSWARQALAHFTALGMPADRPIYFSVDWDAGPADWPDVDAALRGAASVVGAARVGVYGSYATVEHCAKAGTARWFWQTYAWSAGKWSSRCHLQQYRNGVTIGGADCDLDRAMQSDYGQWGAEMPLTGDDVNTIFNTDGQIGAPPPASPDKFWTAGQFLRNGYNEAKAAHAAASQAVAAAAALSTQVSALGTSLGAAIQALAAQDQVDVPALAAALAQAVVAALPSGQDDVTPAELQEALVGALKELVNGPA